MLKKVSWPKLLRLIQGYVAIDVIGTSAVRGQPEDTVRTVREFLKKLHLRKIPHRSQSVYDDWLNRQTRRLRSILPNPAQPWGIARKALNLFMRSCLYNHFLYDEFKLARLEPWLEIPLDGVVARGLRKHAGRGTLPQWPGLEGLTPDISRAYQQHAREYAESLHLPALVFLDNYLWLQGR